MNKFDVVDQLRGILQLHGGQDALDKFEWLLQVWNTDRDHDYPSIEEGSPDDEA